MKRRFGAFLFIIGLAMLGLFLLSDVADNPAFGLLVGGVFVLAIGAVLLLTTPAKPPAPTDRFHGVRSLGKKKQPPAKK